MDESIAWGLAGVLWGGLCVALVRILVGRRGGTSRRALPPAPPPTPWGLADGGLFLLLVILAAGAVLALRRSIGVTQPIGLDIELWSFAALDLRSGNPSYMEPGYPALVALYGVWTGITNLDAAAQVALLASVVLPGGVFLVGRELGAPRWAALVAAALAMGQPRVLSLGQQVSPDSVTAVLLCALGFTVARWAARPSAGRLALLLLVVAATTLVRHHGLVAAGLLSLLFLATPAPWPGRGGRVLLVVAVVILAPLLAGQTPGLPTGVAWAGRLQVVVDDAFSARPSWSRKIDMGTDPLSIFLHSVGNTPVGWAWVALCLGLMAWARPSSRRWRRRCPRS